MELLRTATSKDQARSSIGSGATLEGVYSETINRILAQPPFRKEQALRILKWLTYSRTALTSKQLREALAITDGEELDYDRAPGPEILLDVCSGLVIVNPISTVVQLSHGTARDHLHGVSRQLFPSADLDLTIACISYISMARFERLCPTSESLQQREEDGCLANYSAMFWADHVEASEEQVLLPHLLRFVQSSNSSSAVQLIKSGDGGLLGGAAGPHDYRRSLCQEMIPAAYLCAQFGLRKTLAELCKSDNSSCKQAVSWGACYYPLHLAVWRNDEVLCRTLLDNGASPHTPDKRGVTPLQLLCRLHSNDHRRTLGLVRIILESMTDRDQQDQDGDTALHTAARRASSDLVKELLDHRWNPNIQNKDGNTPMHLLILSKAKLSENENARWTLVWLLGKYANPAVLNNAGQSCLDLALESHWEDCVESLLHASDLPGNRHFAKMPELRSTGRLECYSQKLEHS